MRQISAATLLSFVSLSLAPVALSCADLTPLASGTCGNGVVDANEDCDGNDPLCGKPTEAFACRRKCDTSTTAKEVCPSGGGCGIDGICRIPTGTFSMAGDSLSAGVFSMQVGDFDGDGRKDILGTSVRSAAGTTLRFHYFGDRATLTDTKVLAAGAAGPLVSDINGDKRDDVVFGFNGLAVFQGSSNRELLPNVLTSATVPRRDIKTGFTIVALPRQNPLIPSVLPTGTASAIVGIVKQGTDTQLLSILDNRPLFNAKAEFVGLPQWTSLDAARPDRDTCGQVVVGSGKGNIGQISVAKICNGISWESSVLVNIPFPDLGAFFVADLNNDQLPDILAVRTGSGAGKAGKLVAFMNITSAFPDKWIATQEIDVGNVPSAPGAPPNPEDKPLAVADLNGDGFGDLIMPTGIYLAQPSVVPIAPNVPRGPGSYLASPNREPRTDPWTTARIGDVNGDKMPDIVATTGGEASSQIEVLVSFKSATAPFYDTTPFRLTSDGDLNKENVSVGDLDGDGADDIAAIFRTAEGEETVGIAFGRGTGSPDPFIIAANHPYAKTIYSIPTSEGRRRTLLLTSEPVGNQDTNIADLATTGDRVSISPLILRSKDNPLWSWVPSQLARGTFMLTDAKTGAAASTDTVVALAQGYANSSATELSFFASKLDATGAPSTADQSIKSLADCIPNLKGVAAQRKTQPVFALGRLAGTADAAFVLSAGKGTNVELSMITVPPGASCAPVTLGSVEGSRDLTADASLRLVDVDGDGKTDIVAAVSKDPSTRRLYVFFGDGAGKVSAPIAIVPPPSSEAEKKGSENLVIGFAKAWSKPGDPPAIAIAMRNRLVIMRAKPDRTFELASELTALANQDATGRNAWLQRGSDLVAGDFDGDGVEDLAIANSGTFRILRQLPVRQ